MNGLAPLRFVGVKGTEEQDEDSPSYYNNFEATEVANQVGIVSIILISYNACSISYTALNHLVKMQGIG